MLYRYYAVFVPAEDGYSIVFPDLTLATSGDDFEQSMLMAQDCLQGYLEVSLDVGDEIPQPSCKEEVEKRVVEDPFYAEDLEPGWFVVPVEVEASRDEARARLIKLRMEKGPFKYYAIFSPSGATIPDLDITVAGNDYEEAYINATNALFEYVGDKLANGVELPKASTLDELNVPDGCSAEEVYG